MQKQRIMYAFNDNTNWSTILGDAEGSLELPEKIEKIAILAMGTAILSLLKTSILEEHKARITDFTKRGIDFYVCSGTMHKYGITKEMLLPELKVAPDGTDIKILELKEEGYFLFALDYI